MKNEVKTWIQNNKKKLIIGSSVIASTAVVYFGTKKLLENDKIMTHFARELMKYRVYKQGYCCSIVSVYHKKGITDAQAVQIIDEAVKKFEEIYRAAGVIN